MPHNKVQSFDLLKAGASDIHQCSDLLAVETPLEIRLGHDDENFYTLAVTLCTPAQVKALVTGYLFTDGIVAKKKEIKSIHVHDNEFGLVAETVVAIEVDFHRFLNNRHGMVHSSCGLCGKTSFDDLLLISYPKIKAAKQTIDSSVVKSLPNRLKEKQKAFIQTGGIHACALFSLTGELLLVSEDIGRHNALDKLIGTAMDQGLLPLSNYLLLLSGRISFELVHKALMAGAILLTAIGAPSSLSIELAQSNQMTVMGFVKQNSFNIYCKSAQHNIVFID